MTIHKKMTEVYTTQPIQIDQHFAEDYFEGTVLNGKYVIISYLSSGTYGDIFSAFDKESNTQVVIKVHKLQNDSFKYEVDALKFLNQHTDKVTRHFVVPMLDYFIEQQVKCIVFPRYELTLKELVDMSFGKGLNLSLIRHYTYQLLKVQQMLESYEVVHLDIKSTNIMIKRFQNKANIKLIDFGNFISLDELNQLIIESSFQTIWYRAPEMVLRHEEYTNAIDIWSIGCLLYELYTSEALFQAKNEPDLINLIYQILGLPTSSFLNECKKSREFFNYNGKTRKWSNSWYIGPSLRGMILSKKPSSPETESFIDFLSKMICWNPSHRWNSTQLLSHPFMLSFCTSLDLDI